MFPALWLPMLHTPTMHVVCLCCWLWTFPEHPSPSFMIGPHSNPWSLPGLNMFGPTQYPWYIINFLLSILPWLWVSPHFQTNRILVHTTTRTHTHVDNIYIYIIYVTYIYICLCLFMFYLNKREERERKRERERDTGLYWCCWRESVRQREMDRLTDRNRFYIKR